MASSSHNIREQARVRRELEAQGFRVRTTGDGHLLIVNPETGQHASYTCSTGGARNRQNCQAKLRRIGADIRL